MERVAVLPVEVVVPDGDTICVRLEMRAQPVGDAEKVLFAGRIVGSAPEVVVAESELSDGDGVVLQADVSVIVELRNALLVERTRVVLDSRPFPRTACCTRLARSGWHLHSRWELRARK